MNRFLKKVAFFLLPPFFLLAITEALLPATAFTHRHWEALAFRTMVPSEGIMYPNRNSFLANTEGDLCYNTKFAHKHPVRWITDKLGYRNDHFEAAPDILVIGDSFIAGSDLDQPATLTNRLLAKAGGALKVYNMAPAEFSNFDRNLRKGILEKPKVLIFSLVERHRPEPILYYTNSTVRKLKDKMKDLFAVGNMNVYLDKALRFYSIDWIRARVHQSHGFGVPAKKDPAMFFYNGTFRERPFNEIQATVRTICTYKKYCDSLGIRFLYLPMPDKETVYYDVVPFKEQPDYLFRLDSLLRLNGVATINTLGIYNEHRQRSKTILYKRDDSHWNETAVDLVADAILAAVRQDIFVKQELAPE